MNWGLISLIMLVVAIILGFSRKLNVGLLCIAFAVVLGPLAGFKAANIISGWEYRSIHDVAGGHVLI